MKAFLVADHAGGGCTQCLSDPRGSRRGCVAGQGIMTHRHSHFPVFLLILAGQLFLATCHILWFPFAPDWETDWSSPLACEAVVFFYRGIGILTYPYVLHGGVLQESRGVK
jgi:hypothetical protein